MPWGGTGTTPALSSETGHRAPLLSQTAAIVQPVSGWQCRYCSAENTEEELGVCRACGYLELDPEGFDPQVPPEGVASETSTTTESGDPYRRQDGERSAVFLVEFRKSKLSAARVGLVFAATAIVMRVLRQNSSSEAVVFPLLALGAGILALIVMAIPRRTDLRIKVAEQSLGFGLDGVPDGQHQAVARERIEEIVARCIAPTERDRDLRFEVVALTAKDEVVVAPNLRELGQARWLANALAEAVGPRAVET